MQVRKNTKNPHSIVSRIAIFRFLTSFRYPVNHLLVNSCKILLIIIIPIVDWLIIFKPFTFAHSLGSSAKTRNTQIPFMCLLNILIIQNDLQLYTLVARLSVLGIQYLVQTKPFLASFQLESMKWLLNPFGLSMQISFSRENG